MSVVEYLKKLSKLHGISGREDSVREFMKKSWKNTVIPLKLITLGI